MADITMAADEVGERFVSYSVHKLGQYVSRIEACLERLTEEQIWARGSDAENAAGNLLIHLQGNVRQWILGAVGGETDQRDRDSEFAAREGAAKADLFARLNETVMAAQGVISRLTAEDLLRTVHVQGYKLSALEAVYHVVEHFGQHTAQIILLTKMATQADIGFYRHLKQSEPHNQKTP